MGKVYPKKKQSKKSKQKRRIRDSNKYLKAGALSHLGNSKASSSKACMDLGKKRVAVMDTEKSDDGALFLNKSSNENPVNLLPESFRLGHMTGHVDMLKENNLQRTPSTPRPDEGKAGYDSRLETLPMELLVKILCHLHHDELKAVFHVSKRIRTAVFIARKFHFDYTTPDRSRQEMLNTTTPQPRQRWPFVSKEEERRRIKTLPRTPKAPRQGSRPPSRLKVIEMGQAVATLFQEPAFSPGYIVPSVMSKPMCKLFPSNRVLFDEELELCQAVAQNKLR